MSQSPAPSQNPLLRNVLDPDRQWQAVLDRLPGDLDRSAVDYEAVIRRRRITSAAMLLRLLFAYATGMSLQMVATWAEAIQLTSVSAVDLGQRFRHAAAWLSYLITQLLLQRAGLGRGLALRVRIADATHVQRPGRKTTDQRLHLGMDLRRMQVDHVELTGPEAGESLQRLPVAAGELIIGDRGLASRPGLWAVHRHHAWTLVRLAWEKLPLRWADGTRCVLAPLLRPLAPGASQEWAVEVVPTKEIPAIPGRLIAYRLTDEELPRARTTRRRKQRKTYRKDRPPRLLRDGLETCAYLLLFTTLPAALASTAQVLALYRLRWQIELLIKRLKSIGHLGVIHAKTDALTRTTVYAKLLLALLSENLCQSAAVFSPEQEDPTRPVSHWRGLQLARLTLILHILLPLALAWWEQMAPHEAARFCDSPRKKRPKQSAEARLRTTELEAKVA